MALSLNPWRSCTARLTELVLCVCVSMTIFNFVVQPFINTCLTSGGSRKPKTGVHKTLHSYICRDLVATYDYN